MSHDNTFDYHAHILACAQGQSASLHALCRHEAPHMLALADTWLGQTQRAQQVVVDTFVLIWRHANHYQSRDVHARAWLYSILRHRLKYESRDASQAAALRWQHLPTLPAFVFDSLTQDDKRLLQAAYCMGLDSRSVAQLSAEPAKVAQRLNQALAALQADQGMQSSTLGAVDEQLLVAYVIGIADGDGRQRAEQLLQSHATAADHVLHWESACLAFVDALPNNHAPGTETVLVLICRQLQLPAAPPPPRVIKPVSAVPPSASPVAPSAPTQPVAQANVTSAPAPNTEAITRPAPPAQSPTTNTRSATTTPPPTVRREPSVEQEAPNALLRTPSYTPEAPPAAPAALPTPPSRSKARTQTEAVPPAPLLDDLEDEEDYPAERTTFPHRWAMALAALLVIGILGYRWGAPLLTPPAPVEPPRPYLAQVAVLQAPGSSSTPGWVLTLDSQQQMQLKPLVNVELPATEAIYLWTQGQHDTSPRLLSRIMPDTPLQLTAAQAGPVLPAQIFEMTLEPIRDTLPVSPEGAVLFIGRTVQVADQAALNPPTPAAPRQ